MNEQLSILIVDDEVHARTSIRLKIDPERFPAEFVEEAEDGFDALDKMKKHHFDVVLTDIRMAGMDGLELIGLLKEQNTDTRFVIVSGYNDFDYARTGLRLGVEDYLLKPVREEQLNEQLERISSCITESRKEKLLQETLHTAFSQQQFMSEQQSLNRLLKGELAVEEIEQIGLYTILGHSTKSFELSSTVLALQFRQPLYLGAQPDIKQYLEIEALFTACRFSVRPVLVFNLMNNRELWAIVSDKLLDGTRGQQLHDCMSLSLLEKYRNLGLEVAIGIGSSASSPQLLQSSRKEAQVACRNKLLGGYNRIYRFLELKTDTQAQMVRVRTDDLQLIARSLNVKNIPEAKIRLGTWLDQLVEAETNYPQFIHQVMGLYRLLLQHFHDDADPEVDRIFLQQLYHLDDVSDIKLLFCDYLDNLFHREDFKTILDGKEIVRLSIEFIHVHYREQITLESLAEKYHIHPNYLCRAFKKHCNYNFNEYLTRVRMDQAYSMLYSGNAKVLEVSEILGYSDSKYFSKVFKKHFGISPSQLTLTHGKCCVEL